MYSSAGNVSFNFRYKYHPLFPSISFYRLVFYVIYLFIDSYSTLFIFRVSSLTCFPLPFLFFYSFVKFSCYAYDFSYFLFSESSFAFYLFLFNIFFIIVDPSRKRFYLISLLSLSASTIFYTLFFKYCLDFLCHFSFIFSSFFYVLLPIPVSSFIRFSCNASLLPTALYSAQIIIPL